MSLQVDPSRLVRQPLMLHQREPGEYWVIVAGFVAGRMSRYQAPDGDIRWLWHLTGPQNLAKDISEYGDDDTLNKAKESLRSLLQSCIDEASQSNSSIAWMP